jgi:hypothetical protein
MLGFTVKKRRLSPTYKSAAPGLGGTQSSRSFVEAAPHTAREAEALNDARAGWAGFNVG